MRILILSPYPILPPLHGGRVRTARLGEGLARAGAEVVLLCPWYPGQPREGRVADAFTCRSHFLPANVLPLTLEWLASPLALLSLQPLPRRYRCTFADYDVVQFEFSAYARWMALVPDGIKVVYSAHNVDWDYCRNDGARHVLWRSSLRRVAQLERLAVERSDLVLTCAEEDAERLRQLYGNPRRSVVVPNGCQASLLQFDRGLLRARSRAALGLGPDDRAILFIGGDASHNREAVRFLLAQVLPQLEPNTRLLIVGRSAGARAPSPDGRARSFGFVEDLRPYFAAADVAVNPVAHGSGSSVKLVECLAAGLPVVSTPVGVRGIGDSAAGVRVVPREGFAEALRGSLADLRPDRAALARLTWEHLGRAVFATYQELCAR